MDPNKKKLSNIGFYTLVIVILISVVFLLREDNGTVSVDTYTDVVHLFRDEKVRSVVLDDDKLIMELRETYKDSLIVTYELANVQFFLDDMGSLIKEQVEADLLKFDYPKKWEAPAWMSLVPWIVIIVVFFIFWYFIMNRSAGGVSGGGGGGDRSAVRFGRARTRLGSDEKKKVTFNDVAGADEEKEELQEIVEYLRSPRKFIEIGARIPKGVLLVGPPGTGKTLIAKAVAGEAGVQFLSISGSDFVELYVGVGASRVRDLFEQAKKNSPCIIFIDEIDAVGRQRGAGMGGGHDEREQTLNQLLVEMDGFGTNEGVVVIAATNRQDILDNALLRPGRFDRQVYVGLPDIRGREEILKVHAKGKMLGDDIDLKSIAKGSPGFTGADLENLLNEAALLAARRGKRFISMPDVEEAMLKVMAGPEKKSRVVTEKEKKLTAFHEAGHAVASFFLENTDPVHQITIIPRGRAGGMTIYRPQEDRSYRSRREMFERIVGALGGRVAERLKLGDVSTGASSDIQEASGIARSMVTKYGMSDKIGPISFDSSGSSVFIGRDFGQTKSYSEKVAAEIDDEVKRIFDEADALCQKILVEHDDILMITADYLLENETMDGKVFETLCRTGELPPKEEKVEEEEQLETMNEDEMDPEVRRFFEEATEDPISDSSV